MGLLTKTKELFSRGIEKVSAFGSSVLEYVGRKAVSAGWTDTAERCRTGIEVCEESRVKWKDRADRYQAENRFGQSYKPIGYKPEPPMRSRENACITGVNQLLNGKKLEDKLRSQTPEERLDFVEQIAEVASNALGVKTEPIEYYRGGNASFGAYNREHNRIYLNEVYVTSDNIYFVKEQIFTIFHETMHALQWKAIEDAKQGKNEIGISTDLLLEWAENFDYYIRPEVDYEAYRNQPLEREAYGLEWRMKDSF